MDQALPGDAAPTCTEQYHTPVLVAYHKWARIVLSLYVDKVSGNSSTKQTEPLTPPI